MKSSSFHKISADKTNVFYKIFARFVHTPLNIINNSHQLKDIDENIKQSRFALNYLIEQYPKLDKNSSPARKLSDLFWLNLDWHILKKEFGEINILDIGCGSGGYYNKLQEYSDNKINEYYGLDIKSNENWKSLTENNNSIKFKKYNGTNIYGLIPEKTNLIISQSAIEHFIEDITIFKEIASFIKNSKNAITQIHLFPSAECVKLYPFHGVRQYTPRTISKITRLFSEFSEVELISMGGEESNKIHINYILNGIFKKDIREIKSEKYEQECFNAIKKDLIAKNTKEISFYALIIKTLKR